MSHNIWYNPPLIYYWHRNWVFYLIKKFGWQNFWKSGRKSKKWNWICLLVFVIATWANRENYTVNFQIFLHKNFQNFTEKNFKRKKWSRSRLNWVGMRKENYEERKDWEVFKKLTGIFWPKMADFDRKWPKIGRVMANFRSSDIPITSMNKKHHQVTN